MRDDLKRQLDELFSKREAAKSTAAVQKQATESKEAAFLREFVAVQDQVIRPAMQEIGDMLSAKGFKFNITSRKEESDPDNRQRASIECVFYDAADDDWDPHQCPKFSLICQKEKGNVLLHASTIAPRRGGASGPVGEYKLSDLTADLVQKKILGVFAEAYG